MDVLTVDYTSDTAPALFCKSLKETGFAVLKHHPMPVSLIEQFYQVWRDFFLSDSKHQYLHEQQSQAGYFPFRSENAKDYQVHDLKEFYHFYPWAKAPVAAQEVTVSMYQSLTQLAKNLLQWIEDQLPQQVARSLAMPLRDMITDSANTLLRILHYPPLASDAEQGAVRAAAHEDINLITLLPAATAPGLEVLDRYGQWHTVTCDPGNIVVNVGDMLQMCTQHYYKSTTHRVTNPVSALENTSRFSVPLFLHPRPEVPLSTGCTAAEYLNERLRQIGIY